MLPVLTLILRPSIWLFNSLAVSSQRSARAGEILNAANNASVAASKVGRRNCGPKAIVMPLCAIEPRARISCKGRARKSTRLSETVENDADPEGDHGEDAVQRGNADQHCGEPQPLAACGKRDGAGGHQRKCDDPDGRLEGGDTAKIQPV